MHVTRSVSLYLCSHIHASDLCHTAVRLHYCDLVCRSFVVVYAFDSDILVFLFELHVVVWLWLNCVRVELSLPKDSGFPGQKGLFVCGDCFAGETKAIIRDFEVEKLVFLTW